MEPGRLIMRRLALFLLLAPACLLASCSDDAPAPRPVETDIPEGLDSDAGPSAQPAADAGIGTPMEDRVATIGLLNKRNNVSQDFEMKPGDQRRAGDVIIRLSACERTPPWEMPKETGAFVQVLVQDRSEEWKRVFSGWLFKNSPSLNVVEHPIYDVWVKDCAMSFPGDGDSPAPEPEPAASASSEE